MRKSLDYTCICRIKSIIYWLSKYLVAFIVNLDGLANYSRDRTLHLADCTIDKLVNALVYIYDER